jgi:hypothetical protein
VISKLKKIALAAVCLLLTAVAADATLPPKLAIQSLFPNYFVFYGDDQWHAGYTLILTNYHEDRLAGFIGFRTRLC